MGAQLDATTVLPEIHETIDSEEQPPFNGVASIIGSPSRFPLVTVTWRRWFVRFCRAKEMRYGLTAWWRGRQPTSRAVVGASAALPGIWYVVCILATALMVSGCGAAPRWRADDQPTRVDVTTLLCATDPGPLFREMHATEIPAIPLRQHLRPCCAFGAQLGVSVGPIPIPGYCIGNVLGPDDVGRHYYDSGLLQVGVKGDDSGLVHSEHNGLVYTCRGGFIDTAHVRDYADWAIFLGTTIARNLETGTLINLPNEGGTRQILVRPAAPTLVDQLGPRRLAIPLSQWLAFQLSIWHEIATWFGWASVDAFPERVSAFSPEDLYSNAIGTKIAAAVAAQRAARTEFLFNRSVDGWMKQILGYLGAVPEGAGEEAMASVDKLWWDSGRRLPDPHLVLRRNMDVGPEIRPWLVPARLAGPALRAACGADTQPLVLANPDGIGGRRFSDAATLTIDVDDALAAREPFRSLGRRITQDDFPAIIAAIRAQNRIEFGIDTDRPD